MKQLEQKLTAPIETSADAITPVEAIKVDPIESDQQQERKNKAQDLKKFKQTDKLIKAITDLSTLTKKKADDEKKDKTPKTVLGFLGKMAKEGVKSTVGGLKDGLLSKVGLGKNQAIGGFLAERKKAKLEDLQSKVDFRSKIAAHTEGGRALQAKINEASVKDKDGNIKDPKAVRKLEEQLTRRSSRLQSVHEGRSKQIEKLQDEKSAVTSKGMTYSDKSEAVLQRKKSKQETRFMSKDQKETYTLEKEADREWERSRSEEVKKKKAYALRIKQGIKKDKMATAKVEPAPKAKAVTEPDELDRAYSQAERAGDKVSMMLIEKARSQRDSSKTEIKKTKESGVAPVAKESGVAPVAKESIQATNSDDLLDINEKQLAALNKLVAAASVTEEDKLEAKKPETNSIVKVVEKEKPKEEKGIFDSLTDMLKGMIPGFDVLTKLPSMFSAIAPALSAIAPAAGVAAAGTAGYMFGKHVVNPALDSAAEAITGTKGETVGTALYKGVDKIASVFGGSDEDKQKEAELQSYQKHYNKKVSDGTLTPKLAAFFEKQGIKVDKSKITEPVAKVEAPAETPREVQAAELSKATTTATEIAKTEAARTSAPAASNTSNNTTINNTTNTTRINPPARNFDPTYNERLRSSFA